MGHLAALLRSFNSAIRLVGFSALLMASQAWAEEPVLSPFHSDGCSLFPNGTPNSPNLWCGCCLAHDLVYWQGGTALDKEKADADLRHCVAAAAGSDVLAKLMEIGVKTGGTPQLPTPFRWGYGWTPKRGYLALTDKESEQVHDKLKQQSYAEVAAKICVTPKQ